MANSKESPCPHLDKLTACLANEKLPDADRSRVEAALVRYHSWRSEIDLIQSKATESKTFPLPDMVKSLNEYRKFVDLELIFDSNDDFLYRSKGQLKLDNSVVEEFLPRLVHPTVIPEVKDLELVVGPTTTFSSTYFASSLDSPQKGAGMMIREKDQDFAISKRLYLKASHRPDFEESVTRESFLAYIVAECKTNLDKTMFQEACATAVDVKSAVTGARYFLLCEWLDMTPLSTAPTDIERNVLELGYF